MSEISNRILGNSLTIYIGKITSLLITFFIFIHLANYLGETLYGRLSFAITYVSTFTVIVNFGINQIVVREIAGGRGNPEMLLGAGIIIKAIMTFLSLFIADTIVFICNYPKETAIAIWVISLNLVLSSKLSSFRTIFETPFQARLFMDIPIVFNILDNVLFAVSIFIFTTKYQANLLDIALLYTFCNIPGTILLFIKFSKITSVKLTGTIKLIKYLVKESLPLAIYLFFSILNTKVDVLLLSGFKGDAEVGLYSAATRLVYPLMFLSTSFTISLFPLLSKYYNTDKNKFYKTFKLGIKFITLIGIFLSTTLFVNSDKIILTLYKPDYSQSIPAFRILILVLAFNFLNFYFVDFFISIRKQKINIFVLALALAINLIFNFILIPKYSIIGASYVRLITALVTFILFVLLITKTCVEKNIFELKIIPLLILFASVQFFLRQFHLTLIFIISAIYYFILLWILKIITHDELLILKIFLMTKNKFIKN